MRTTVMFPLELMRAAKTRSAELGESLKTLLTRAVEMELGRRTTPGRSRPRVALPMFGKAGATPVSLSNADLEQALADVDTASVESAMSPRRTARRRKSR